MTDKSRQSEQKLHIPDPHSQINIENSALFSSTKDIFDGSLKVAKATGIPLSSDWAGVPPIHESRGIQVEKSEDLVHLIELPLYKAARALFDVGIQTTESNAHFDPGEEETSILLGIKWDTLNEKQKNMAEKFCNDEPDKWTHISAEKHPDHYEALYLNWKVQKEKTSPRQVKAYVDKKVSELIQGSIKIKAT